MRHDDVHTLKSLKSVDEHRPILFPKDIVSNLDFKIRLDAENRPIKGAVMEAAEGQAVGNDRLTVRMSVRQDMRCVQEFGVFQLADGAALPVSIDYLVAESALVQALLDRACCVPTSVDIRVRLANFAWKNNVGVEF